MALDAQSEDIQWQTEPRYRGTKAEFVRCSAMRGNIDPAPLNPVLNPRTDGEVIGVIDTNDVVGLDYDTGKELWRTSLKDG